jgi:hypothetical protein
LIAANGRAAAFRRRKPRKNGRLSVKNWPFSVVKTARFQGFPRKIAGRDK